MIAFIRGLFLAVAAVCAWRARQTAAPLSPQQDAQVRAIVRDYLLKNPEVIEEAQAALAAKRAVEKQAKLAPKLAKFVRDPRRFAVGPANAKVTVVEFFDYRCPYCKAAFDWTQGSDQDEQGCAFRLRGISNSRAQFVGSIQGGGRIDEAGAVISSSTMR